MNFLYIIIIKLLIFINYYIRKNNIRLNIFKNIKTKYAPDINYTYDINLIRKYYNNNKNKFIKVKKYKGFTSVVLKLKYNKFYIIQKKIKYINKKSNYYVSNDVINESFYNEINILKKLKNENFVPKILDINYYKKSIILTYAGNSLSNTIENINLDIIPKDWKFQLYHILKILKKYNIYHNDITCRNLCILNNQFYLIDFGNSKLFIDTYYRNYTLNILFESKDIKEFFNKIENNAKKTRDCCYGFN